MSTHRQAILDRIWRGQDPLSQLPTNLIAPDMQGWNSQHRYLAEGIATHCPPIIVEVGVWKGGSTIFMANELKKSGQTGLVIAVDTWLGSSEHWFDPNFHKLMAFMNGYPALYHKFAANVLHANVADHVIPLPLDSLNAAVLLQRLQIRPSMIHIDAGHDYASVTADLKAWWPLLQPGGLLVGDDYHAERIWPEVKRAIDDFFAALGYPPVEHANAKCRIRKAL